MKVYAIIVDFEVYDHAKDSIVIRHSVDRVFNTKESAEEWLDNLCKQVFSDDDLCKNATYHIKEVPFFDCVPEIHE